MMTATYRLNWKKLLLSICLLGHSNAIWAERSPDIDGEYFSQLGTLTSKIRSIEYTVDICTEQYPGTKRANQQALNQWRTRQRAVITDVATRFKGIPEYWAKLGPKDAKDAPQNWRKLNEALDGIRGQLKEQYITRLGPEDFRRLCSAYPQVLLSADMDLSRVYAKEMKTIQRGPGD